MLDKQPVVQVDFSRELPKQFVQECSVYFLLPSWAIAGWHSTARKLDTPADDTDHNLTMEERVTYSGMNPTPMISSTRRWRVRPQGAVDNVTDDVTQLEFLQAPQGKFKLKDFGLGEPTTAIGDAESGVKAK